MTSYSTIDEPAIIDFSRRNTITQVRGKSITSSSDNCRETPTADFSGASSGYGRASRVQPYANDAFFFTDSLVVRADARWILTPDG